MHTIMLDVVYSIGCLQDTFFFPHIGLASILGCSSNLFLNVYGMSCLVVIWLLPQVTLSWSVVLYVGSRQIGSFLAVKFYVLLHVASFPADVHCGALQN
jgi:hypothetical protein